MPIPAHSDSSLCLFEDLKEKRPDGIVRVVRSHPHIPPRPDCRQTEGEFEQLALNNLAKVFL